MNHLLLLGRLLPVGLTFLLSACATHPGMKMQRSEDPGDVTLITLDPGHFHAALVQKTTYSRVSPDVFVYAPRGPDVQDHLSRIESFNSRAEDPTQWQEHVYTGDDYLARMIREHPGNVVVLSGNNRSKAAYIKACVEAGFNVLADKPMCIDPAGHRLLEEAFAAAGKNGVLLYDIMTERSEITTILQRELANDTALFGRLERGTRDDPAIVKESVHHFFKQVAGKPIKRPAWYFDTTQQGEGIVDVTTHLVDLTMWTCFPGEALDFDREVRMLAARRWPTLITREQFQKVTRLADFPDFLRPKLNDEGVLPCSANGEMTIALRGVHTRIAVRWDFEAPAGGGDTHFSILRGSKANLVVRQGKPQNYRPELYIEPGSGDRRILADAVEAAVARLARTYPGVGVEGEGDAWRVLIPDRYRIGHEAHFRQVLERYLGFLERGELPDWEVPNMLTKYRITTAAFERAGQK